MDTISRQAVLDYIDSMPCEVTKDGRYMIHRIRLTEYISDTLPSAERKKGKWVQKKQVPPEYVGSWFCSECEGIAMRAWKNHQQHRTAFCPYCGARMSQGEEDG